MLPISSSQLLANQLLSYGLSKKAAAIAAEYEEDRFIECTEKEQKALQAPLSFLQFTSSSFSSFSIEEWRISVLKTLESPDMLSLDLIEELSIHPLLNALFKMHAGVSEGYTVSAHTVLVLMTAQKYQKTLSPHVVRVVPWREFLLFLSLHDIGKGLALQENKGNANDFKEAELKNTKRILEHILSQLRISSRTIAIFSELVSDDTQGLFLKEKIQEREAFDRIVKMAKSCSLDPAPFYTLFEVFHRVDAASYPSLFASIFEEYGNGEGLLRKQRSLPPEPLELRHIPKNQAKVDSLFRRITEFV